MRKNIFRNKVMLLTLLNIGCHLEVSVQCFQGNQNPHENQGRDEVFQDPDATANTGVQAARDPDEIIGLEGYNDPKRVDTLRWVSAMQSLVYTVYFENDAELAMAAASKVTITVPLHKRSSTTPPLV